MSKIGGLLLWRKPGQTISIEHGLVEITVEKIRSGQAQIRIKAKGVQIARKEKLEAGDAEG